MFWSLRHRLSGLLESARWGILDRSVHLAACANRRRFSSTVFIGITGSAGKTTTKSIVSELLSAQGRVLSSLESQNDNQSVDRLILGLRRPVRYCVAEIAAYQPGCLDRSLRAVRPRIGVLTVIAQEHYGVFRTLDAVASEKRKLIYSLPSDGVAVLNVDDPYIREIGEGCRARIIWIGKDESADIKLLDVRSRWPEALVLEIEYEGIRYSVSTRLHGKQLAVPVLAALGVAVATGMPITDAIAGLGKAEPAEGRMQIVECEDGVVFLRDDFKAPDWSYDAALAYLGDADAKRKIAVIGTISDSKREDRARYTKAARRALEVADLVLIVGGKNLSSSRVREISGDGRLKVFRNVRGAAEFLKGELIPGDMVLLKGTNKQDHLVRIMLHRSRDVLCWEMTCGRTGFCGGRCDRVYIGPPEGLARQTVDVEWGEKPEGARRPIIVGIGNPGERYVDTPHNAGQIFIDRLVAKAAARWEKSEEGTMAEISIGGVAVLVYKPDTFVNLTGPNLSKLLLRIAGHPGDCVVVHDDISLALGDSRLKRDGGDAGHKGIKSIVHAFGTDEVFRIRIGVRRDGDARTVKEAVLARLSDSDRTALESGMQKAESILERTVAEIVAGRPQGLHGTCNVS